MAAQLQARPLARRNARCPQKPEHRLRNFLRRGEIGRNDQVGMGARRRQPAHLLLVQPRRKLIVSSQGNRISPGIQQHEHGGRSAVTPQVWNSRMFLRNCARVVAAADERLYECSFS